ncbi:MAG: GNAT family N-acetyltransferase [Actinomycetota bacterium]
MIPGTEATHTGFDALDMVTRLLRRNRRADPTHGLWESADVQWWWRMARPTDELPQLFWFDADGEPIAAAILTAWPTSVSLSPIALPGVDGDGWLHVVRRGIDHAHIHGIDTVELEVAETDRALMAELERRAFLADASERITEAWLPRETPPAVSSLMPGYRLLRRDNDLDRPHHNVRSGPDLERRLRETSLYRADLDLVVRTVDGDAAAYGLFWFDPVTRTGLVEPMRTNDAHQRRGLARHVLTAGVNALFATGAERIKICYEVDNPASGRLYRDVGFAPFRSTVLYTGPTGVSDPSKAR